MSWVKRLYFRQIAAILIFSLLVIGSVPAESMAYVVGSNFQEAPSSLITRAADMENIQRVLELKAVSGKLESMGLTMSEIKSRLDRLSDQDLHQFASRINSLAPGGDCGDCGVGILVGLIVIALLVYIIIKLTEHKIVVK
jgi:uncharacterized membrane protein YjjP (DUF1212 family)